MLLYDETTTKNYYTIESDQILYIFCHDTVYNGSDWRISFSLKGGVSASWTYDSKEKSMAAMDRLHKIINAQSINTISL